MKRLKDFLKTNRITSRTYHILRDFKNRIFEPISDILAIRNFILERKISRDPGKIRVVFLMQFVPAWNKFSYIYDKMKPKM